MSGKFSSAVMMASLMAIALASNYAEELGDANRSRVPSAVSRTKEQVLGSVERPILRHTTKLQGPLETSIELIGARPEHAGDVFVIRGVITSPETLNDVEFKWSLPKDVELINGERSGVIAVLSENQATNVQLTLKTRTGANHQIHLVTAADRNGSRFAQSVQHNTLLEPEMTASRQDMRKAVKASNDVKVVH